MRRSRTRPGSRSGASSGQDADQRPGRGLGRGLDTAVRIGVLLVGLGTLATIATLLPLALDIDALPVGVYLLCFLAPLGLGIILVALWRRARSRSARIAGTDGPH